MFSAEHISALLACDDAIRLVVDTIPTLAWSARSDGSAEFFNQPWLDYTGLSADRALGWGWKVAIHPEDLPRLLETFQEAVDSRRPFEVDGRLRRSDGAFRWFLFRGNPLLDESGHIVKWYGTNTDLEDRKRVEDALRAAERDLRLIVDTVPGLVWTMTAAGDVEVVNQHMLAYFGRPLQELKDWSSFLHPDDRARVVAYWRSTIDAGQAYEVEHRLRRADGVYRWFQARGLPLKDADGHLVRWYNLLTDIDDRKRAEDALRASEQHLRRVVDGIPGFVFTATADGDVEFVNKQILDYTGRTLEELKRWQTTDLVHPDDLPQLVDELRRSIETGQSNGVEHRVRGADGRYRWFDVRRLPQRDTQGRIIRWYLVLVDIDDRKRAEEALRVSERRLGLLVDSIPGFVAVMSADGELEHVNRQVLDYFGLALEELKRWDTSNVVHPDDLPQVMAAWRHSVETGQPYDIELRHLRADGVYRWFQSRGVPVRDVEGRILRWHLLLTDIDDRKRAEETVRENEQSLRLTLDSIPGFVATLNAAGELEHSNRQTLDYFGKTTEELRNWAATDAIHPDDVAGFAAAWTHAIKTGQPFEYEQRSRRADGVYRWMLARFQPQRDAQGRMVRWYCSVTDINDRKQTEIDLQRAFEEINRLKDRLHDENVILREQIDQAFMFEEIVGSSAVLKGVLASVVKVAPTDSTVLITGETGTGKELIARAIHKRSRRATHPFISVNCSSIPASLIASELFGHEKGAFTGAVQQRRGRFELAHSGTIFLDEIGELPADTQIALLRVLQERQFERVGGSRVISTDVRVIAATNRDLSPAIAAGEFRADLFYRLNVFPIHVPPLRDRKEDIPMLVEYFVKRYGGKAGKRITRINKKTMKSFQSYQWPGNIRELQNIIERSVILSTGDSLWIDEAWLGGPEVPDRESSGTLSERLKRHERDVIEAALARSKGRVAGPDGAAAKLGMKRSTLDFRIKQLKIKKHKFIDD
jgi:PAS domain S-box-containing protein